jgi:NTE family protein
VAKKRKLKRALVLSGGGARGAYEAGVLCFLFEELPKTLGHAPSIDLVSGTSVGAIHASFIAATADLGTERGAQLRGVWESMVFAELFGSAFSEVVALPRRVVRALRAPKALREGEPPDRLYGLLNTANLERLVRDAIPWPRIRRNLAEEHIDGVCVAATQISTGRAVVFHDARGYRAEAWSHDPAMIARPAKLGPAHALASAAIPVVFPAVRIGPTYYADGGLRVNTPLAPVLRFGADRVMTIALRRGPAEGPEADLAARQLESYGNPLFMFGKVLNTLILDHVENDLAHLRMLNDVVRRVRRAAGDEVWARVNEAVIAERGHPMRVIEEYTLRPSEEVGVVASQALHGEDGGERAPTAIRLLRRVFDLGDDPFEADLLSYVLFDRSFTSRLLALGYEDAKRNVADLAQFFSDD